MTDVELHIEDSGGDGRPVVLIHPWPVSSASWAPQLEALTAAGHRVVRYDRRGFGRSGRPEHGFDYDTLAGDLDRVLTQLDLSDAALVGHSMGGGEVARYVSVFGEQRVRSVVFVAAVPPFLLHGDDNPDGPLQEEGYRTMRQQLDETPGEFLPGFVRGFYSNAEGLQATEEQVAAGIAMAEQAGPVARLATMDAWATTDFRDDIGTITVPTLVLHGDGDQMTPFEGSGRRTHETIEHSELVVVPGGTHGLNLTHADETNRALLDFLA